MRSAFAILILGAAAAVAAPQAARTVPPAHRSARTVIPDGAVEREPGRFYFTDKDGKKWIYSRTPFGIARTEDKGAPSAAKKDSLAGTKITQSGDTVTFERTSPFGTSRWQKKLADLDENERAAVERSRGSDAAPAAKSAEAAAKQE